MSTGSRVQRRQLSDILVDEGVVPREQIDEALQIRNTTGETLGAVLIDMDCVNSDDLAKVVSMNYQLPFISRRNYEFDTRLLEIFTPEFLHQHKVLPFDSIGDMLLFAVTEIPDEHALSEIPRITRKKAAFFVASIDEVNRHLQEHRPLSEDSPLLQRRKHIKPVAKQEDESPDAAVYVEQTSEELLEALDNTWDSIFDEMASGDTDEE